MQQALGGGVTPAEAARYAINVMATSPSRVAHLPDSKTDREFLVTRTAIAAIPVFPEIPVPGMPVDLADLLTAVLAHDVLEVRDLLLRAVTERGVVTTWEGLVAPVLSGVATADGRQVSVADVRVFADTVSGLLATLTVDAPIPSGRRVLLAAAPPAHPGPEFRGLAAALARSRVNLRVAAPASRSALAGSISGSEPDVVAVWLDESSPDVTGLVRWLRRQRRGLRVAVGGPGLADAAVPPSVTEFSGLAEAAEKIAVLVE